MASQFVHLHNHSHYSIGDAISKITDIFSLADQMNMPAIALTDHGNMFGIAEFLMVAQQYPHINAIVGCEIYVSPEDMKKKPSPGQKNYYHMLLLAKDEIGYTNLSKIVSAGSLEGFYYRPRVDYKLLQEHASGIIASSACLGGEIPQLVLQRQEALAEKKIHFFQDIFGKDNFFLELMNHGLPEQKIANQGLLKLSQKTGATVIATNDVHYPYAGDDLAHDAFLCIQEGKKVHDPARKKYHSKEFYFKSEQEMLLAMQDFSKESVTNTLYVASLCNYKPKLGGLHIPHFTTPAQQNEMDYMQELCYQNLQKKYPNPSQNVQDRLEYELSVVKKMGFASYFLIVQDFIQYAKNNHISVGPGRGSAAGSLVAYLLGITDLDPLQYNLLFERFLNPGRISMPDIDTDFDDTQRDRIIQYVTEKYGKDRVAQIITFGRMKAKSVIRDIGRVLDIPLSEIDVLAKLIPNNIDLKQAHDTVPELKEKINSSETTKKMYSLALRLENSIRQISTHAAGIIIGKDTLTNFVPLHKDRKTNAIITQFEGKHLEEFGLLKMDFLGLRNLRIIRNAILKVKETQQVIVDFSKIPLNDPKTYQNILKEGRGIAIFQCESPGMKALMKKIQPSTFEDIIALIALYRPGPLKSGMVDDFIKNKKLPTHTIPFPHKNLKTILKDTYGVIIYQEQIMQISQKIANFSLADADNLRKAMGKKDIHKMESMKNLFIEGAKNNQYDSLFSQQLFQNMAKFAEYGFNKSHSAAYALIAFQTAYLKAHYPVEYMCSVLSAESNNVDNLGKYIDECQQLGIQILPPDINKSSLDFTTEENNIRFGLSAIKNIGEKNLISILEERNINGEFKSIVDLISRTSINKKIIEGLCFGSSLDSLDLNRATIIHNVDKLLSYSHALKKNSHTGMGDLFAQQIKPEEYLQIQKVQEFSEEEILNMEKENLGFYSTAHPLDKYRQQIHNLSSHSTLDIKLIKDNIDTDTQDTLTEIPENINIVGRILNYQVKMTKKNDPMAIFTLEDLESDIAMVAFPKTYKQYQTLLESKDPLCFSIKIDFNKYEIQGIVNSIFTIDQALKKIPKRNFEQDNINHTKIDLVATIDKPAIIKEKKPTIFHITISANMILEIDIMTLKEIFKQNPGQSPIIMEFLGKNNIIKTLQLPPDYSIKITPLMISEIRALPYVIDIKTKPSKE